MSFEEAIIKNIKYIPVVVTTLATAYLLTLILWSLCA
jgi:hypothetical protein